MIWRKRWRTESFGWVHGDDGKKPSYDERTGALPLEVAQALGIVPGDEVVISTVDGHCTITKATSQVGRFFGMVEPRSQPEDWQAVREEMERAVAFDGVEETRG